MAASLNEAVAPWSALLLDADSLRPVTVPAPEEMTTAGAGAAVLALALVLPPESLLVLSMPLVKPHTVATTRAYTEVFASDVGVAIDNTTIIPTSMRQAGFTTAVVLPPDGNFSGMNPRLRFGVKGPAVSCPAWSVSLSANGSGGGGGGDMYMNSGDGGDGGNNGGVHEFEWPATVEFRGGGCRSSRSSQINCSAVVGIGKGVGYAEISLQGWALPPPVSPSASKLLPGVFVGGEAIGIDPWEAPLYTGQVNVSQCAELCGRRSNWADLGPNCVAFRLTADGAGTGGALCTMLSSRLLSGDRPAKAGEIVTSGIALSRTVNVAMKASCQTPSSQPFSYLLFVSLVVD